MNDVIELSEHEVVAIFFQLQGNRPGSRIPQKQMGYNLYWLKKALTKVKWYSQG